MPFCESGVRYLPFKAIRLIAVIKPFYRELARARAVRLQRAVYTWARCLSGTPTFNPDKNCRGARKAVLARLIGRSIIC